MRIGLIAIVAAASVAAGGSVQRAEPAAPSASGDVRWRWQHSVPATKALRYSITFRTLAA